MEHFNFKVHIQCITYNHAPFIADALNGFTMQETDFPFVCIIVDDASTDGEQEVIERYMEEHFELEDKDNTILEETDDYRLVFACHKENRNCYFAVYYLKFNHFQAKKPKAPYFKEWSNHVKYIAHCEGDDYWIHPKKLQRQVDFLEEHSEYTMTCNRTYLYSERKHKIIGENYCYNKTRDIITKDVIYRTGLFISTCSIVHRKEVADKKPDYWAKCKVGDYPLQIACVMKGKAYYFNDLMSVYRVQNSDSWMGRQKWGEIDEGRLVVIKSQINMFKGFGNDFPQYMLFFKNKIANQINRFIPVYLSRKEIKQYCDFFKEEIAYFSLLQKMDMWIRIHRIPKATGLYLRLFQGQYSQRKKVY